MTERINLNLLNKMDTLDCQESLNFLRHSLLACRQKSVRNEIRRHIFKVEERLSSINQKPHLN